MPWSIHGNTQLSVGTNAMPCGLSVARRTLKANPFGTCRRASTERALSCAFTKATTRFCPPPLFFQNCATTLQSFQNCIAQPLFSRDHVLTDHRCPVSSVVFLFFRGGALMNRDEGRIISSALLLSCFPLCDPERG